ncbi:ABC transporter permease [Lihuaxuella thermophila]|uniref:ABC-2 type transport system permease protein n=1 Tax=Lihuaxuella thermophila TaxID=1173111 RepID=A0A1H8IFS0_9BACL|nr:ABC transporter permease [Lihuaxuella thermophila]SEN67201.1 ABC-2 type transport system permease protein [Lihuaxuella thermophila]
MSVLYVNVINEIQKIFAQRKTKGMLGFALFIPAVLAGILDYTQHRWGVRIFSGTDFSFLVLDWLTTTILPLFIFMVSIELFVGESSTRTLKLTLVRPITRWKVYASKVLAMGIFVMLMLGLIGIGSVTAGSLMFHGASFNALLQVLLAYAIDFIPMLTLGIFAVFIGQYLNHTGSAFALCTMLFFIAKIAVMFFPSLEAFLFTSYTDWHSLWINSSVPVNDLIHITLVILSSLVLFFTIGLYQFEIKEV